MFVLCLSLLIDAIELVHILFLPCKSFHLAHEDDSTDDHQQEKYDLVILQSTGIHVRFVALFDLGIPLQSNWLALTSLILSSLTPSCSKKSRLSNGQWTVSMR